MRCTSTSHLLFAALVSILIVTSRLPTSAQDQPRDDRQKLDAMLKQGGQHWSVPDKLRELEAPAAGTFVYLVPKQDQVFELRKGERGRYETTIELKWTKPAGTVIPVSRAKNVRTHITFYQFQDSESWVFSNTRSIIAARENSGSLNFTVTTNKPFEGERDLYFLVTTNDNPGQPVANFLKLRVRTLD